MKKKDDGILSDWMGQGVYDPGSGSILPCKPVQKADPFERPLQAPRQTIKQWAKSKEGRQAIAQEKELARPKARLWRAESGKWWFRASSGEYLYDGNRQKLIETLIFTGRSDEAIAREMKKFLAANQDYTPDPDLWLRLSETLCMAEKPLNAQNLAWAWKKIKPGVEARSLQIARDGISEIQKLAADREYLDSLTDEEINQARQAVQRARAAGLI